jgi:hypothetical protein
MATGRIDLIAQRLDELEARGVIGDWYTGTPNGRKWVFSPCGFAERSLTTAQVEDFILGAQAALNLAYEPEPAPGGAVAQLRARLVAEGLDVELVQEFVTLFAESHGLRL